MNASLGHSLLTLAIYVLAAARLTRLINFDTVLDPLRLWIAERAAAARQASDTASAAGEQEKVAAAAARTGRWHAVASFLGCPWCIGFWVALVAAPIPVYLIGWQWWCVVPIALACSHLVGIASPLSEDEELEFSPAAQQLSERA